MKPILFHTDTWRIAFCDVPAKHIRKLHIAAVTYQTPNDYWGKKLAFKPCQTFGIWGLPTKDELPSWIAEQLAKSHDDYSVKVGVGVANPLDPFSRKAGVKSVDVNNIVTKLVFRSVERYKDFTRVKFVLGDRYTLEVKYTDQHSFPIIEQAPLFSSNKDFKENMTFDFDWSKY